MSSNANTNPKRMVSGWFDGIQEPLDSSSVKAAIRPDPKGA